MDPQDMPDTWQLSFSPEYLGDDFCEEFIAGAWHPRLQVQVTCSAAQSNRSLACLSGSNWFILSSRSPFRQNGDGLAHVSQSVPTPLGNRASEAVAFRGYILEPPIHSWSDAQDIINYWREEHSRHNGVFAAVRIVHGGKQIEFVTDAFGIAALYYRELDGGILFSTNSRFLAGERDRIDNIAGRVLIQCNSVYGNRSLTEGVQRVAPGTALMYNLQGATHRRWFSYSDLPTGSKSITAAGLRKIEEAFQDTIDRCLRLRIPGHLLLLSSGDDSRRILAALRSRDVPLSALTVRVLLRENRDLDGYWAAEIAKELGLKHMTVDLPSPDVFARLDHLRRTLMDGHGCEHTWFLTMHHHLPAHSCIIFDGLGGDVFGNTGFGEREFHTAEESKKLRMILSKVVSDGFDGVLDACHWPSADAVRGMLAEFLRDLPEGRNRSDLAFLLMRTRSGPGMSSQRLIPAGHVTVFPYFDLNYASVTLDIDPLEKLPPRTLQSRCLAEFWPRYYAFPGSRRMPPDSKPGSPEPKKRLWLACFEHLRSETHFPFHCDLGTLLTHRGYALAILSAADHGLSHRVRWWLEPLLTLMARQTGNKVCWTSAFIRKAAAVAEDPFTAIQKS